MSKTGRKFIWVVCIGFIIIACAILAVSASSQKLSVDFYHLSSSKITDGQTIRLVVLSDLHNHQFGEDNAELVDQIQKLAPDLIVMAGDMVNQGDPDTSVAVSLCRQLTETAPIYYGLGNHEGIMIHDKGIPLQTELREIGVTVLADMMTETEIKGVPVLIGSVSTGPTLYDQYSRSFVDSFEQAGSEDTFKLMISHVPSLRICT